MIVFWIIGFSFLVVGLLVSIPGKNIRWKTSVQRFPMPVLSEFR